MLLLSVSFLQGTIHFKITKNCLKAESTLPDWSMFFSSLFRNIAHLQIKSQYTAKEEKQFLTSFYNHNGGRGWQAILHFGSGICLWWCWYLLSADLFAPVSAPGVPLVKLFWKWGAGKTTDPSQELQGNPEPWSWVQTGPVSSAWVRTGMTGRKEREEGMRGKGKKNIIYQTKFFKQLNLNMDKVMFLIN